MTMLAPPTKPPTMSKPPIRPTLPVNIAKPPSPGAGPARVPKTFKVEAWTGKGEGEKILIYGPNGKGKTTLASMAPNPIFIGFDDGGRKIRNPKTNEPVNAIPGIESFEDFRDALHQTDLFPRGSSLVIDTITLAENKATEYVLRTVKTEGGKFAQNIEDYGWGKGYVYLLDPIFLLLSDFDALIRKGVNVILLAQQGLGTTANAAGLDYLQEGPVLCSKPAKDQNVRGTVIGWCDNVFRIGHPDVSVEKLNKQATKGKATGDMSRQIFTEPEAWYVAKNRMNGTLPPVISFGSREDDSIWQFVFGGATA